MYLGIHSGHHSGVSLVSETGDIIYAISEERFTWQKEQGGFPARALRYVLNKVTSDVQKICLVRLPLIRHILRDVSFTLNAYCNSRSRPNIAFMLNQYLSKRKSGRTSDNINIADFKGKFKDVAVTEIEHHIAHAAGAYFTSGFDKAVILTLDGEGNLYSGGIYAGQGCRVIRGKKFFLNRVTIGQDYEKITALLGFIPTRHAGKVTGLAAYGRFNEKCIERMKSYLKFCWFQKAPEGFFNYHHYQVLSEEGLEGLRREREVTFGDFSKEDIAYAIQYLTEGRTLSIIKESVDDFHTGNIVLSGGVFGNVKLNQRIKELGFKNVFIHPAMSDEGLSLGAILFCLGHDKGIKPFRLKDVYFGSEYSEDDYKKTLKENGLQFRRVSDIESEIAKLLADGKVVARYSGRLEYGPRALGNRSILCQATDKSVNDWLNKKLRRTEFMPFAPVTLAEYADRCYLNIAGAEYTAKFMTITFDCTDYMKEVSPGVVHVDGTARPQILSNEDNPAYYKILREYHRLTGIPSLINTSFNIHEEPIVESPYDAVRAFKLSRLDYLAMGNFMVKGE